MSSVLRRGLGVFCSRLKLFKKFDKYFLKEYLSKIMSINLSHFLINESGFERMRANDVYPEDMEYSDFRIWNLECIAALNEYEYNWTVELCRRMSKKQISLMDEENSAVFIAHNIYFDRNKNLCITNPC